MSFNCRDQFYNHNSQYPMPLFSFCKILNATLMASTIETGHAKNVATFEDLISFCTVAG